MVLKRDRYVTMLTMRYEVTYNVYMKIDILLLIIMCDIDMEQKSTKIEDNKKKE